MLFSQHLFPCGHEITLKIFFFALGQTSHIEFDYDLYIYGGKLIFSASNFLCLVILSKDVQMHHNGAARDMKNVPLSP